MTEFKFGNNLKPSVFYVSGGKKTVLQSRTTVDGIFASDGCGIAAEIHFKKTKSGFQYRIIAENKGDTAFEPETLGVNLGIDTYLETYPEWNEKYFPSFFRCEKTHFYGYFMQPLSCAVIGVVCKEPIASYGWDYNYIDGHGWGHRIYGAYVSLLNALPLPAHHPQELTVLNPSQRIERTISFVLCKDLNGFAEMLAERGVPYISAERFTLAQGEEINYKIACVDKYSAVLTSPNGEIMTDKTVLKTGYYTLCVETEAGKTAEAVFYCRDSWESYLKRARTEVIRKPPHATTHCESQYGFYTGFLAAKHYPKPEEDSIINGMFDEIMPCIFDFENIRPRLIPERIQNTASLIGILTDRYEADPDNNIDSLEKASRFADWLITRQREDGGYYRENTHYTCVIYPAKSMLELVTAERKAAKNHPQFREAAERHFASAKKAVDNLAELLENIGTEGEHTLEDGMISCSCLQLAYFALFLPENERQRYTAAAEHMLRVHRCLEQLATPDCRSRGTTIRYWEAQYDIILRKNMVTSPHGWSAWLGYALYYLYLLTGKEEYLTQLMDLNGACAQLMSEDGNLRWGFVIDPYVNVSEMLTRDFENEVRDAYASVRPAEPAYRGKFTSAVLEGERYSDMISGWYRTCDGQRVTGGHNDCGLILPDRVLDVDKQGACCDNDVHEIFKCIEETVLDKGFVLRRSDGSLLCYGCTAEADGAVIKVKCTEKATRLHLNLKEKSTVLWNGNRYSVNGGMTVLTDEP